MRYFSFVTAMILIGVTAAAQAQQTLDGQMQRLQQGKPATQGSYPPSANEWPAKAAMATRPGSLIDSVGEGAIPAMPIQAMTNGEITYLSGGISDEELAQL